MYQDTRDIYCEACGYNLHNKRYGECPECGSVFDRRKGTGYRDTPFDPIGQWLLSNGRLISTGLWIVFLAVFVILHIVSREREHLYWAVAMAILALADILLFFLKPYKNKSST